MRHRALAIAAIAVSMPFAASAQEVSGLAAMHDLRREGGRLCMSDHFHWGNGSGSTKQAAQKAAIRSWIDFTDLEYGGRWASFSNAASRKTSFTKESAGWSATVEGRPCRR
jgi:hypothetical protein